MIPRYTRPAMGTIWSEEHKFATWLQVELAVCEAWMEHGRVPADDMAKLRRAWPPSLERIAAIEREIDHDLNAFLMAVAEQLGDESPLPPPGFDLLRCGRHGNRHAFAGRR